MDTIFLHQAELSKRWHMSVRTLERWRYEQIGVRYVKVGGRVLYRVTDVEAFEKAGLVQTSSRS